VDTILVPCWPTAPETAEAAGRVRAAAPDRVDVGAYVTVLPPTDPANLGPHLHRLAAAGVSELHLYHLGLAAPDRQRLIRRYARRATVKETA
jgi:hypothetical protein